MVRLVTVRSPCVHANWAALGFCVFSAFQRWLPMQQGFGAVVRSLAADSDAVAVAVAVSAAVAVAAFSFYRWCNLQTDTWHSLI